LIEAAERRPGLDVRFRLAGPAGVDDLDDVGSRLAHALLDVASADLTVELWRARAPGRGTVITRLLAARRGPRERSRDLFSPPERIVEAAIRESVYGHLRAALAEALLVETRLRVAVAERARRAVEEREAALATELRVLERELITSELVELTAAREALIGGPRRRVDRPGEPRRCVDGTKRRGSK
jgi:hypothetical protein